MTRVRPLAAFVLLLLMAPAAAAATFKSSGTLKIAPTSRVLVLATDPTMQEVLSSDIAVARRPTAKKASDVTLTVTLIQRELTPDVTLDAVAPGVPAAANLIRAAGYHGLNRQPRAQQSPLPPDVQAYMHQGRPPSQPIVPSIQDIYRLSNPQGSGSALGLPRFANQQPYSSPLLGGQYDTAIVAHAVLSNGQGDLTVVAVAHPNDDLEQVKKEIAERIANAVLH